MSQRGCERVSPQRCPSGWVIWNCRKYQSPSTAGHLVVTPRSPAQAHRWIEAYAQLYVAFTALTARSLPGNLIPASTPAGIQKPEKGPGWGPAYHFIPTGTTTGGGTVYTFLWNDNAGLSLDAAVGTSLRSVWTYPVASPWPTTLPGTPA